MNISWSLEKTDIEKIQRFVLQNDNHFVKKRLERNVHRQNISLDKDAIIWMLIMCLLTSQQRSGPLTPISRFLIKKPFPITYNNISSYPDTENLIRLILQQNGLNRFNNKIPKFFYSNFDILEKSNWQLINKLGVELNGQHTKTIERKIADEIDDLFDGYGPKQSRNFLQGLGLTKYEIPIDSRITKWLNDFGFPVTLTSAPLQDKGYYHFVSDGIQYLCEQADIYPCILDAAIFSSYDSREWTAENIVF